MTDQQQATTRSNLVVGTSCGVAAALGWAAGFVVAKHGVSIGFSPADLALHRFLWTGLFLTPFALRTGVVRLGGIGWTRGLLLAVLSGPGQAMLAYTGFTLVPLGHGTVIQPASAVLFGLLGASFFLGETPTRARIVGAFVIVGGLIVISAESVTTIGSHGVGGDLLFACAGLFWAVFGTLLRAWNVDATRATTVVGAMSVFVFAPLFVALEGIDTMIRIGWAENLLQIVVQGLVAGVGPIYLFAQSVTLLGAGRAATFPALVPVFALIVGLLAFGVVPSWPQIVGLIIVVAGFRLTLK